ncbi:RluA family pseudouridine synthase [Acidovorax sp. SUPP1855]|uniref:RluA family pseudouridine synthase n=1 Tax=Acidovorax sp. SUPP1855 TaxID=431774 RepID=UPI0023DE5235|nr:RluA family pseudouridine synthase [Acidovorax sp. SUPP1855]GKS82493.1 RluA family pseudouridine synthase [Acidovorax sp. SUPP1855]
MSTLPSGPGLFPEGEAGTEDLEEGGEASQEIRQFAIGEAQHGERLDRALADQVPEFSRSYLQQLLAQGSVLLNGQAAAKPAARVKAGDVVAVELRPTQQSQAFRPESMPIDVVFEDAHLLVIHKPAGLVVHPAPGNWSGTLLNGLLARDPKALLVPRAGIVHRLDKDTSGLMVVARERGVMDALVRMIAAREVSRQYLAIGHRPWSGPEQRVVEGSIGRDPRNRLRMAVVDLATQSGKPARTDIALLDSVDPVCFVRCTLHTGRTHQIRVHMASLRHPLVGDALYGGEAAGGLARQALHAYRLAFVHPMTGEPMEFHAPMPPDMENALDFWGLRYNRA